MESTFLHKVYSLINDFIHPHELEKIASNELRVDQTKRCPITGLDISMQAKNSRFISPQGVEWYYTHQAKIFRQKLLPFLHSRQVKFLGNAEFNQIAHNIRNADSNPRNNARRSIQRLLNDKDCLFDNMKLIDKSKLKEAGMV